MLTDEIYPNSPLIDVACEIRFPGEMQVECERHLFWEQVRNDYPDILVPGAQPGQAPALQHYRFRSSDHKRAVLVALNSFSYSEVEYRGFKLFSDELLRLLAVFSRCFKSISKINRIGWRYVNVIPFVREDGGIPLRRFLRFEPHLPDSMIGASAAIQFRVERIVEGGSVILLMQNVNKADQPGLEGLQVDIDVVAQNRELSLASVAEEITRSHAMGRRLFEDLITDEYREYLRGNIL